MPSQNNKIAQTHDDVFAWAANNFSSLTSPELDKNLGEKILLWENTTQDHLAGNNPFEQHRLKLASAEWDFRAHGGCDETIRSDLSDYKSFNPAVTTQFWEQKIGALKIQSKSKSDKKQSDIDAIRRNEQEAWRKDYEKKLLEWQINEIQIKRNAFFKELEDWLSTILQLQDVFEELGIEPGVFWDTSAGRLSQQDISFLKKWAEYLKKDEGIRQLCELMGRLQKEEQSHRTEIINSTVQYAITAPDIFSNEEIVGIELGRDLENVIPQELALLSDPDVAILFDLKYVENRLMCFSKQGYKSEIVEENIQEEITVTDDDKLGPIIICVDTSGSMSGAPENIAKALTLTLSSRAVAQHRKCYLINFSTSIETLDLTPPKGINDLISFLKLSFHGGTDVAPALYEGLRMMSEADYKKADLLVISDFVLSGLSADIVAMCKKQQLAENRFFALSIGSFGMRRVDEGVFDQNWIYNPQTGGISELNNIVEWISKF